MGVREDIPGEKYPPAKPGLATPLFALGGVLVLLFFFRAFVRTRHHRRLADIVQRNDQTQYVKAGSFGASVKKHVLYAPLWSMRHSHEFRLLGRFHMGTLPLRLEAMLVLGYIALNAAFILVFIDWWADLNQKLYQIKFAAGHIAVMNTPGLVLMAGRNNPLIPILGVSFDSFNFVHRWIGRTVAAEAVVHMGCVVGAMVRERE